MKELPRDNGLEWKLHMMDAERRQATDALFSDIPLQNPAQHFLLFVIEQGSDQEVPLSQGDIAKALKLSPATVTASLRFLEKFDLIQRQPDEHDLRKNRVTVTTEGRAMAEKCRGAMKELTDTMFDGFTEEEKTELSGFFERMFSNLRTITKNKKEETTF